MFESRNKGDCGRSSAKTELKVTCDGLARDLAHRELYFNWTCVLRDWRSTRPSLCVLAREGSFGHSKQLARNETVQVKMKRLSA
jgi:hypothetical protein